MNKQKTALWKALGIDFLCALLLCALLAVYFVFLPRSAVGEMLSVQGQPAFFSLPAAGSDPASDLEELLTPYKTGDETRTVLKTFADADKQVLLWKCVSGSGADQLVWYAADVFVTSIYALRANVSVDENNTVVNRSVPRQSRDCGALLAVTGDTFSMSKDGVIVRNGLLYRNDVRTFNDVCALCLDGTMKIFYRKDLYSIQEIAAAGAWQVLTFGPSLLDDDGQEKTSFNIAASHLSDLSLRHPRTAVGMVSPGHFVFVVVDGRNEGYSKGATFPELSGIMKNEGCTVAYNLDGGRSAVMTWQGKTVNEPYKNGRGISDILYIPEAPYEIPETGKETAE